MQRVATIRGDSKTVKGLFRKEADLSAGVHDGAGNVDVECARRRRHGDAYVEARVAAEGRSSRRDDWGDKRRRFWSSLIGVELGVALPREFVPQVTRLAASAWRSISRTGIVCSP